MSKAAAALADAGDVFAPELPAGEKPLVAKGSRERWVIRPAASSIGQETKMSKKSLRDRVEKKLGHSRFRLVYRGAKEWGIIAIGGKDMGYIIDCWPYLIHVRKRYAGFIDWVLGIDIDEYCINIE